MESPVSFTGHQEAREICLRGGKSGFPDKLPPSRSPSPQRTRRSGIRTGRPRATARATAMATAPALQLVLHPSATLVST